MLRLNLGAGNTKLEGFTSVDLYDKEADIQADICELPFKSNSIDEIVCYQVIEHVPYQNSTKVFAEMYRVLKKGGTAIIETPDIDVICAKILSEGLTMPMIYNLVGEYYRPWDKDRYEDWENVAAAIHRNPWNFQRLSDEANKVGFQSSQVTNMEEMVSKFPENLRAVLTK